MALEPRFDGVVHVELDLQDGAFAFEAGQYCFCEVGRISDLEWHLHLVRGAVGPTDHSI